MTVEARGALTDALAARLVDYLAALGNDVAVLDGEDLAEDLAGLFDASTIGGVHVFALIPPSAADVHGEERMDDSARTPESEGTTRGGMEGLVGSPTGGESAGSTTAGSYQLAALVGPYKRQTVELGRRVEMLGALLDRALPHTPRLRSVIRGAWSSARVAHSSDLPVDALDAVMRIVQERNL